MVNSPQVNSPKLAECSEFYKFFNKHMLIEHGSVLLLFSLLCCLLTWPLIKNFTTAITGVGDANSLLWVLWHYKLAFQGKEAFFSTSLLYYPYGATMITVPLYPIVGLLALPFWWAGPQAAYNGTLLVSFILSAYFTFLLARNLGFDNIVSFFAGLIVILAPIHLTAIFSHLNKAFIGSLPLLFLALIHTLNTKRKPFWVLITAITVLIVLLSSPEQFIYAIIAISFFSAFSFLTSNQDQRFELIQRISFMFILILLITSWYFPLVIDAYKNSNAPIFSFQQSFQHQPDFVQFFLPGSFSQVLGPIFSETLQPYSISPLETAVFLGWTCIILSVIAFIKGGLQARGWVLFTLLIIIFSLGPDLKILGRHLFILPYSLFQYIPGLQSIRTPGRFMLVGFIGLSISASYGLGWIRQQLQEPRRSIVSIIIIGLVLIEAWPQQPWYQIKLRPIPEFYRKISLDDDRYGIFDIPLRPIRDIGYYSSYFIYSYHYQWYQMIHEKGIAAGYIGRPYDRHPLFGYFISNSVNESPYQTTIRVNGLPANRYANARYELAKNNYRYVVFHKPQQYYSDYHNNSWGEIAAKNFIENVFAQQKPVYDDNLVTVFEVGTIEETIKLITTTIALIESNMDNWMEYVLDQQWVHSPAHFYVASPITQSAILEIDIAEINDQCSISSPHEAIITVRSSDFELSKRILINQKIQIPLIVQPGSDIIQLSLSSIEFPDAEPSCYQFKLNFINLHTNIKTIQ